MTAKIVDMSVDPRLLFYIRMKTTVTITSILIAFSLNAQSEWNLKQCIDYGLANHKTNEIYRSNIEKARLVARENVALYLPQVYGDLRIDNFLKLQTLIIPEGTPLLGVPTTEDREIQFGKKYATIGTIEAEQALYNRLLLVSFRGLKPNMEVANLQEQQNKESLIYNISQAYIQAHTLQQQIALLSENKKKFTQQLDIINLQVEKGVAKKIDASRISVALNNIASQLDVAGSSYELALNRLKNSIGMELSETLALNDSIELSPAKPLAEDSYDLGGKTEIRLQQTP